MRIRFGEFCFDGEARRVERGGEEVHLSPKAFELLAILIAARPRALAKAALQDSLWPDTVVVEANLPNLVSEIRRAFGEDAQDGRTIRTVPRFGYAFAADAFEPDGAGERQFELRLGMREIRLRPGVNPLGRNLDSIVPFSSTSVSRQHARIVIRGTVAVLEDLDSRHGTFVGGRRVEGSVELKEGDQVILAGEFAGTFHVLPVPDKTTSTYAPPPAPVER